MFFQDTCLGSLVNDMIALESTSPGKDCPNPAPNPNTDPPTVCNNGVCVCCSDETKRLLETTECIDQVRSQPRFIYEVVRSDIRNNEPRTRDNLVNRMIQLCGADQVPTELGGCRDCATTGSTCGEGCAENGCEDDQGAVCLNTGRRKRSVNATSRIIPINQAFQSSSGSTVNTDLTFGKKTSKIVKIQKIRDYTSSLATHFTLRNLE